MRVASLEATVENMIAQAIEDALQNDDLGLQQEARAWLWVCCPDLADQLELPRPLDLEDGGYLEDAEPSAAYQTVLAYAQRLPFF